MGHCDPLTKTSDNLKPFKKKREDIIPAYSGV